MDSLLNEIHYFVMHCDILTLHLMSVLFCDMIFQDYS